MNAAVKYEQNVLLAAQMRICNCIDLLSTVNKIILQTNPCTDQSKLCVALRQVKEGQEVTFTCKVSGEPYPEVTWSLRGQRLTATDRCVMTDNVDQQTHVLRLTNVTTEDIGTVEVTASNPSGQVSCSANLDVEGQ